MATVFVSHRLADQAEADQLAVDLRGRGHQVWIDSWHIQLGDSIVAKIDEGLAGAAYLVLCLSAEGVDSPWVGQEWRSALARQLGGTGVRILPVRLTGGALPPILADIKYADLTTDWGAGVDALCAAMR